MPVFSLNDAEIFHQVQGTGETVLLLHSSVCASDQWQRFFDLANGHYRLVAPDFHGYGQSEPWPGHKALGLCDDAQIATHLLQQSDGPVHLVGHSYGGAVALHIAAAFPERIGSLTLIEPVAFHLLKEDQGTGRRHFSEIHSLAAAVSQAAISGNYLEGMARFVDFWNGPGAWDRLPRDRQIKMSRKLCKVVLDFQAVLNETTPLAAYERLAIPTLLLRGTESPQAAQRVCDILRQTMANSRSIAVHGAGHMLPMTHSDQVNRCIIEHLSRNHITTPASIHRQAA